MPIVTTKQRNILQVDATKRTISTKSSYSNQTQLKPTKRILYKTTTEPLQQINTYPYNILQNKGPRFIPPPTPTPYTQLSII